MALVAAIPGVPETRAMSDCVPVFTQAQHSHFARAVYGRQQVTRRSQRRVQRMRKCQSTPAASRNTTRLTRRLRKRYLQRKSITPYRCDGNGWFAVPCRIVWRESKFNPKADNGSHWGYYQLQYSYLGGDRSVANQHRVAAGLWKGGRGISHWAQTAY